MPGVYDDEKSKEVSKEKLNELEDSFAAPAATSSGSQKLQEEQDLEDAYNAPDAAESGSDKLKQKGGSGSEESGGAGGSGAKGDSDKGSFLSRLKGKKARNGIVGGFIGLGLLGGGFGAFTIASGPFAVIQWGEDLKAMHMKSTEIFQSKRSMAQFLYLLAGQTEKGRLGKVGNYLANKWEKRLNEELGLKSVYAKGTGRLIGYEVIDEYKAADALKDMPELKTAREGGLVDASGTPYDQGGRRVLDMRDDPRATKRAVTKFFGRQIGKNKLTTAIGNRLMIKRDGIKFHPWKNILPDKLESKLDFKRRIDEKSVEYTSGNANVGGTDTAEKKSAREKFTELKGKVQELIKTAKGPLLALGALCGLKAFSSMIDSQNLANMQTAARIGMESVNGASQTQSMKDFNLEQLGVYADRLYDPKTKTAVTDDRGVQYEMGTGKTGFDYISGMRPTAENKKPWFFDVIDVIATPVQPLCDLMADVTGAITNIEGVKQVFEGMQWVLDGLVRGATFVATGKAKSIQDLIDAGVQFFSTQIIPDVPVGAMKGGIDNMGVRYATNDQMLALGGRNLTPSEATAVKTEAMAEQKREFATASWYDRYLNPYVPGSAAGSLALAMPRSRSQFLSNAQKLPTQMASMLAQSFGLGKAFAAPVTYDYGFALVGYSPDEQNDPQYANPFANEAYMLEGDRLERMNELYGKECFFMTIDRDGNITNLGSGDLNNRPAKCDNTTDKEYEAYRFYKADLITGYANACYEGDEESCNQVGMGPQTAATPGATGSTPGQVDMATIFQASDTMQCAAGIDEGVQDGYRNNVLTKVKICNVQGIRVNARIAANVDALMTASRAAGINFSGSGFATMAQQQAKYNNNCKNGACNPPTAKPGTSNHQMGLAVDFSQDGKLLSSSQSGFGWLKANAATYGLQNLPSETWHWSVNGG